MSQILSQLERNADALALLDREFRHRARPGHRRPAPRLAGGRDAALRHRAQRRPTAMAEVFFTVADRAERRGGRRLHPALCPHRPATCGPTIPMRILLTAGLLEAGPVRLPPDLCARSRRRPGLSSRPRSAAPRRCSAIGQDRCRHRGAAALAADHGDLMMVQFALGDLLRREDGSTRRRRPMTAPSPVVAKPDAAALGAVLQPRHHARTESTGTRPRPISARRWS